MEVVSIKKNFKVSQDVFRKICRELKSEIKGNKKDIEKLNELDYKYNKKVVYIEKLIEVIDSYIDCVPMERETQNLMVVHYGNPVVTLEVILQGLLRGQIINLVIDDMCLGVNKFIMTMYKEILRDYKIFDIVSFNNYEVRDDIEGVKEYMDKIYFLGDKNLYTVCKSMSDVEMEYVPYNVIDIYCEDDELYDLSREIFYYCYENSIEAEVHDEMDVAEMVEILNNFGENYCSIILSNDKESVEYFKANVKSKFVYANENPFKDENVRIPDFI